MNIYRPQHYGFYQLVLGFFKVTGPPKINGLNLGRKLISFFRLLCMFSCIDRRAMQHS